MNLETQWMRFTEMRVEIRLSLPVREGRRAGSALFRFANSERTKDTELNVRHAVRLTGPRGTDTLT